MDIILKKDIHKLGYTNDIITVKDGYAQNYLIPQGLAIVADKTNRKVHAEIMKQKAYKQEKAKFEALSLAQKLENVTLKIGAKAAESGKIYGSVNVIQIAEALKDQYKIEVDRKKIFIDGDSIKETGSYEATINLHRDAKVIIKFDVFAE
ncbi:MAG: 50S ribosomal protein L9 [Bacteroidales bacterium]|nr:50S ribosomal protein L9 [Bacteroidales bacterium]